MRTKTSALIPPPISPALPTGRETVVERLRRRLAEAPLDCGCRNVADDLLDRASAEETWCAGQTARRRARKMRDAIVVVLALLGELDELTPEPDLSARRNRRSLRGRHRIRSTGRGRKTGRRGRKQLMSAETVLPQADRSVVRTQRKAGDFSRDGRGRISSMPPILQYGFRPFFFLGAVYAGLAIPAWLWMYFSGYAPPGPFPGLYWHSHEMLFGYLGAVLAGFILTAIPNWTGRLPLSGWPLAGLVLLWLAGRIACATVANPAVALALDIAFPAVLALSVWREVVAGRNWKNAPVAVMITLFGAANALDHAANLDLLPHGLGTRPALGVIAMLLALIGGRIVPSFTRNWLVKTGETRLPSSFGNIDKAALAATAVGAALWAAAPETPVAGVALALAGIFAAPGALAGSPHRANPSC